MLPVLLSQSNLPPHPEVIYQRALQQTQRNNFTPALVDLAIARREFERRNNAEGAYRSYALRQYLLWSINRVTGETLPSWYKSGRCLTVGGNVCAFSVTFLDYESAATPFGGVLILERNQGYRGQEPINGTLDVVVVPKLRPGEQFCGLTQYRRDRTATYQAIAQFRGQEHQEEITNIRRAWRVNPRTRRIESVPTKDVFCENPMP
ncbi:MAG: hypothetical protein HC919_08570 [Oscillatoriales cyanobacterium SM2_2_1]|nr:hypothetical protein [Oscillatoriales cyanobacterium SM2_2_1]